MTTPRSHRLYEHGARLGQVEAMRDNFSKALGEAMAENTHLRESNAELLVALEEAADVLEIAGTRRGIPSHEADRICTRARAAISKARSVK